MHGLWHDVQYGLRGLLKQPVFTAVAAMTLALGLGATTTTFRLAMAKKELQEAEAYQAL